VHLENVKVLLEILVTRHTIGKHFHKLLFK